MEKYIARRVNTKSANTHVREGTAKRRDGRATADAIVEAAQAILRTSGSSKFSLRKVADAASVTLANLQYYYPRREDLLHALFERIAESYERAYDQALEDVADDPVERFSAVIAFLLSDATDSSTRRLFVSVWGLADSIETSSGSLFEDLYAFDVAQLTRFISAIDPSIPAEEVRMRASLIASLIEGIMIVVGSGGRREVRKVASSAQKLALSIAKGTQTLNST